MLGEGILSIYNNHVMLLNPNIHLKRERNGVSANFLKRERKGKGGKM